MKLTIIDNKNKHNLIRIEYIFLSKKDSLYHATVRALLSYVLITASKKYNDNTKLSRALDRLYGAQLVTSGLELSSNIGLSFYLEFVNPSCINDNNYHFKDCIDVLNEVIYNPLLIDGLFDDKIFHQQQQELYDNLLSDYEDQSYTAFLKSRNILYKHMGGYIDSDGFLDDVMKIKNIDLANEYKRMISSDDLIINVFGNISDEDKRYLNIYNDNIKLNPSWNYIKPDNIIYQIDSYDGYESYLRITYYTGIYEVEKKKSLALLLLSRMLAGDATSIFFDEIREKRGLCYSIKSEYSQETSFFTISCEHNKDNTNKIRELIDKIIEDIKNDNFKNEVLESAKELSINKMINKYDSLTSNVYSINKKIIYGIDYSIDDVIEMYKSITREDICNAAKRLSKVLDYLLRGDL